MRTPRLRRDLGLCGVGAATVVIGALVADRHPAPDRRLFALLNHGGGGDSLVLRGVQQAGTPWVLPAVAAGAAIAGRRRLALAAAVALPLEKALEVGIKKVRPTPRPLYVEPTVLRDDAPVEGESFPSGHSAIAFAAATLLAPRLPLAAAALAYAAAAGTAAVRVSQGAHHPVDAIAGAGLGIALGAGLRSVEGTS